MMMTSKRESEMSKSTSRTNRNFYSLCSVEVNEYTLSIEVMVDCVSSLYYKYMKQMAIEYSFISSIISLKNILMERQTDQWIQQSVPGGVNSKFSFLVGLELILFDRSNG